MRVIKFKVWDKNEKRFIEWYNPDPMVSCKDGNVYCHERTDGPDEMNNLRFKGGDAGTGALADISTIISKL